MANTEQFEAIYHCGKKKDAIIRINIGDHKGTYPEFKAGVPTIVEMEVADVLAQRDDFTVNPVMEKAPAKRVTKKTGG